MSGQPVHQHVLHGHTMSVTVSDQKRCLLIINSLLSQCLQVCSDGTVVSGSWDSSLRIWQSDSGVCGRVLRAHAEGKREHGHTCFPFANIGVYCLQCDINKIVSGGGDNMVVLWDTKTGQSIRSFAGHTQEIVSSTNSFNNNSHVFLQLCVKYNDQLIASCSADSTIRLWEINGKTDLSSST